MRKLLSTNLAILALVAALPAGKAAAPIAKFDMRVGPPTEHHNLGNYGTPSVSWLERSVTFSGAGYVILQAFDSSVLAGLVASTCSSGSMLPGPNSRRIEISRDAGGAVTTTQQVGQCDSANPWKPASQTEQWPITAAIAKHTEEAPAYGIELQLDPVRPSGVAANSPMAVMLRLDVADTGAIATIPLTGSQLPNELDPSTWEELWLGPTDLEPQPVIAAVVDARPKK